MKNLMLTLTSLLLLVLAACGPSASEPTPTPDNGSPARATPTADPGLLTPANGGQNNLTGYPPPPPTATPLPENYPPPAQPVPNNPYPAVDDASTIWILHPLGLQCADTSSYAYTNVQAARADLTAAGITVFQVETIELAVCQACDCPTSTHYHAQIAAADLNKAQTLGWTAE